MGHQFFTVAGSWIDVIGLIAAAIGSTLLIEEETESTLRLVTIGEGVQVVGDALQAIGSTDPLQETGDWIEAGGAGTSSFGVALQMEEESKLEGMRLETIGDVLQALGAALNASAQEDERIATANKLESSGATLEAVGVIMRIHGSETNGQTVNAFGAWVQAAGGVLLALLETQELKKIKKASPAARRRTADNRKKT
ncbi:hypothetical protein SAMN05421736_11218 [Evansella caseinilytica]|uniref:Uncharacterized protein n=1 Tax=Evansella caseinilytica TaxID=1503961 RepID=A0A1H3STU8_9BACI|nr:hypothetical protein [Evansella caseinilytica]SDZ41160.1 hypothetical protein SAMN05421736_11218 [Evansella caseinilytica]